MFGIRILFRLVWARSILWVECGIEVPHDEENIVWVLVALVCYILVKHVSDLSCSSRDRGSVDTHGFHGWRVWPGYCRVSYEAMKMLGNFIDNTCSQCEEILSDCLECSCLGGGYLWQLCGENAILG